MAIRLLSCLSLVVLIVASAVAQPVNDNFASASPYNSVSNIVAGAIVGATSEAGEDSRFGYSVWWRWTAPSNGVFTFLAESGQFRPFLLIAPSSTNLLVGATNAVSFGMIAPNRLATEFPITASQGAEYTIALFTYANSPRTGDYTLRAIASAPPTATFVQPASERTRHIVGEPLDLEADAHDADGQIVRVDFFMAATLLGSISSPPFHISASTAGAIADRDARLLLVAVDDAGLFGVGGDVTGNQTEQIRFIAFRQPAPPNDSFAARVPLSGNVTRLEANHGGAGREADEPMASGEQTLWWSWIAPATKSYNVLARGLLSAPQLGVFTNNSLATLDLIGVDQNFSCGNLAWVILQAQAGQTYALSVGDACDTFGGPFTLHVLPMDAPAQIADGRIRLKGEVLNVPVFELFAVGMQGVGWFVECSDDLQNWAPCDDVFPYGWVDGASNWADTFRAQINPTGPSRFYRLHRTP